MILARANSSSNDRQVIATHRTWGSRGRWLPKRLAIRRPTGPKPGWRRRCNALVHGRLQFAHRHQDPWLLYVCICARIKHCCKMGKSTVAKFECKIGGFRVLGGASWSCWLLSGICRVFCSHCQHWASLRQTRLSFWPLQQLDIGWKVIPRSDQGLAINCSRVSPAPINRDDADQKARCTGSGRGCHREVTSLAAPAPVSVTSRVNRRGATSSAPT